MQGELTALKPNLIKTVAETERLMATVQKEKIEVRLVDCRSNNARCVSWAGPGETAACSCLWLHRVGATTQSMGVGDYYSSQNRTSLILLPMQNSNPTTPPPFLGGGAQESHCGR